MIFIIMEKKICSTCKKKLPATEEYFSMRYDRKKPQFQGKCKKCHSEYRKKHYEENKKKYIKKARVYTDSVVSWFLDYKKTLICEACGDDRYWVLDFHHIDPTKKEKTVSSFIRGASKNKAMEEIKKCKVLCSNCHRDFHYNNK